MSKSIGVASLIVNIRIILRVVALVICLLTPVVWALDTGDRAPDWSLQDVNNNPVNYYEDADGAVTVLLFWATWCPYCRELMPHVQELANLYGDRGVVFYALNVWEDGDAGKYVKENGFTFKLMLLADLVAEDYGIKGTPGFLVVDADRRVTYKRMSGASGLEVASAASEAIEAALAKLQLDGGK